MIHWHQHLDRLGVDSDIVIADELGVSRERVRQVRCRMGIPAPPRKYRFRKSLALPWVALLGTMSDADVAELAGVTRVTVSAWRKERGIAKFAQPSKFDVVTDEQWRTLPYRQIAMIADSTAASCCVFWHKHKKHIHRHDGRTLAARKVAA